MTYPILIGIGGKLRSGKDVVADRLVTKHGFVKLGMSDALHEAMLALDPIIDPGDSARGGDPTTYCEAIEEYGYVRVKELFPEARRLLQKLGTEVGRDMIGVNTWTDIMKGKIEGHMSEGRSVVVTGIRFRNELEMVDYFRGSAVWIERPGLNDAPSSTHASENSINWRWFDTVLVNDGTLEDLERQADSLAV